MQSWRASKSSQRNFMASGIMASVQGYNCSSYYFALPKYVGICTGASFDCSFARPFHEDTGDPLPHPCAGVKPLCAAHQKLIIICVRMADVSNHGKVHR